VLLSLANTTTYTAANGDQLLATFQGSALLDPQSGDVSFVGIENLPRRQRALRRRDRKRAARRLGIGLHESRILQRQGKDFVLTLAFAGSAAIA
jgi:hypothetical protein